MSQPTCPSCGSPATSVGQPSKRRFFGCESYLYEGATTLTDQTDLCSAWSALHKIQNLVTTDHETKADFIARVQSILSDSK